jgi:uncharacterized cofD-like protein
MSKLSPKIVVIGGGTGSFTLLGSLKTHTTNITALVNMADDGGSTGVLRDELGVLPPGDIRQCLVALSEASQELRELFNFRFPTGTFEGHSFGNIFLSAVESMTSDFNDAVRITSEILRITGRVLPVTLDNCQLIMECDDLKVSGEFAIAQTQLAPHARPKLHLEPTAHLNPVAKQALLDADLIVIAPGNLYGSLAPAVIVDGMAEVLQAAPAPKAFVCNLVNKPHNTADFAVDEYANELERLIGVPVLDYVLYNTNLPSEELLNAYALEQEYPVRVDEDKLQTAHYKAVPGNFLSNTPPARNKNDSFIQRSLIRHDSAAVAQALLDLLK